MKRNLALLAFAVIAVACGGNVFELEVGQCFDDPDSFDEVANVEIVECAEPHDNEVYELFDLPDGDYPGDTTIEDNAVDGCLAAFDVYVGRDYASSSLDMRFLVPTPDTWGSGDREVVCVLYDLNGAQLTGSVQGTGI